jgi:two-component sensor histidine kinase
VAASVGFDGDSTQDVQIAVHETVTNAIVHGNGPDGSRRIGLEVPAGLAGRTSKAGAGRWPMPTTATRRHLGSGRCDTNLGTGEPNR